MNNKQIASFLKVQAIAFEIELNSGKRPSKQSYLKFMRGAKRLFEDMYGEVPEINGNLFELGEPEYSASFISFWKSVPPKGRRSKRKALMEWKKLNAAEQTIAAEMMFAYGQSGIVKRGFVVEPARWLRDRRFEDHPDAWKCDEKQIDDFSDQLGSALK